MKRILPLALVLIAACSAAPATTPVPTAVVTPEPTAGSEPTATPEPTFDASVIVFGQRVLDLTEEYPEQYGAVADAAGQSAIDLRLASIDLLRWADEEREWFLDNPPADDCYEDSWKATVDFLDDVGSAALLIDAAAESGSDSDTAVALAAIERTVSGMETLGAEIAAMAC